MDQIAEKVRELRQARGWTIEQLGTRAGYTNGTMIHQIEKRGKKPSYGQLKAIAKALEVPVSALADEPSLYQSVTNNANGDHQVVYQHVGGLMTDEFQVILRQVVTEVVDARCAQLLEEVKVALRDAAREADDAQEGEP